MKKKKLKDQHFENLSCLQATDIIGDKGFMTSQLFSITSNCLIKPQDYILKEMVTGLSEITYLTKSSIISGLSPFIYPSITPGFPTFILPLTYISYKYAGKDHFLSVMLKSPGILLLKMADMYKKQQISHGDAEEAYYETGLQLSNFHRKFMSRYKELAKPHQILNATLVQGDAHQGNIFYDKETKEVIFIDNEKITLVSPRNPFGDIENLTIATQLAFIPEHLRNDSPFFNSWLYLSVGHALKGYVNAYPMSERSQVLEELIERFNNPASYAHSYTYPYFVQKKNIFDKIFEEIKNNINK